MVVVNTPPDNHFYCAPPLPCKASLRGRWRQPTSLNQEKSGASDRNFGSSSRFLPCSEPRLLSSWLPTHREREPSSRPAPEAVASCDSEQVQPLPSAGLGSSRRRRRRALLLFLPPRLQRQLAAGLVEKAEAEEAKGRRRGGENGSSRGTRSGTSNREQQQQGRRRGAAVVFPEPPVEESAAGGQGQGQRQSGSRTPQCGHLAVASSESRHGAAGQGGLACRGRRRRRRQMGRLEASKTRAGPRLLVLSAQLVLLLGRAPGGREHRGWLCSAPPPRASPSPSSGQRGAAAGPGARRPARLSFLGLFGGCPRKEPGSRRGWSSQSRSAGGTSAAAPTRGSPVPSEEFFSARQHRLPGAVASRLTRQGQRAGGQRQPCRESSFFEAITGRCFTVLICIGG